MKVTGKKSISSLIKIFLQILIGIGIIVLVLLPLFLQKYIQYINPALEYYPALILLYVSGIPAIIIVYEFIKLFGSLKEDNPFIESNVKALKISSICSLIIAIEYGGGMFLVTNSIFGIIIVGVFIIAWLGLYILAELLQKAIEYKEENDLTI